MLKRGFDYIIGSADEFNMGSRLFHAVSVFISLTLLVKAFFYHFTSLQLASYVCGVALLLELGFYYLSRFRGQLLLAATLSSLKLCLLLIPIYLYNGGLSGNIMLLSAISLFLIVIISPQKQGVIWLAGITVLVLTMVWLEYRDPEFVRQYYTSRGERFIDLSVTYVTITLIIYVGLTVLRIHCDDKTIILAVQTKKLRSLNDEKNKLFSILSRELSAPVLAVRQYLHLAQTSEISHEDKFTMEQDLNRSLDDAQYLLHNVLLWARTQMDMSHVQLEPVKVAELIRRIVGLYEAKALKKGIKLNLNLDEEAAIMADQKMLKVVMRNLISNAIKFTNLEGEISVSAVVEEGNCIIAVKDNGIGLTKEKQEVIFSLNIAPNYGTAHEKGTGLGLVLSKDYIDRQGGKIWFKSITWEGTTFYVSLPIVDLHV
jgi:two-component system sensor histidine kinase/response regulator